MANCIKYWRNKRGMTQQELADKIHMDRAILSRIENPDIPIDPSDELALEIARIFGVLITDIKAPDSNERITERQDNKSEV